MKEMPEGWEPRKAGRPPLADVVPVLRKIQTRPGEWVSFATFSDKVARSLRRQLSARGVETSVSTSVGKRKSAVLYAKWAPETPELDYKEASND